MMFVFLMHIVHKIFVVQYFVDLLSKIPSCSRLCTQKIRLAPMCNAFLS